VPEETEKRKPGRPRKVIPATNIVTEVFHEDGWDNMIIGLGQAQDRSQYTTYGNAVFLDDATLSQLYLGEGLASRIVNVVADDSTREWISLEDEYADEQITPDLERLNAEEALNTAVRWRRLYGGSLILIGALDGRSVDQPLAEDKIRAIEYLKVIDRTCVDITSSIYDTSLSSPTFGKILQYKVRYTVNREQYDMFIHYTRVIELKNDQIPTTSYSSVPDYTKYWGMSSLQPINSALRDLGGINTSIVNILYGYCSGTYKFKGLAQLLAAGGEEKLSKRLRALEMSTSVLNARVLDVDEQFTREYTSLASLPEIVDRFMLNLSGSTGIPVSRLYGKTPSGLNAQGGSEQDNRIYYDLIEADQRNKLMPAIRRLVGLIARTKKIAPEDISITFNSLYQMSEEEKAKVDYQIAQTAKIYHDINMALVEAGIRDGQEYAKELGYEDEYTEPVDDPPPPTTTMPMTGKTVPNVTNGK